MEGFESCLVALGESAKRGWLACGVRVVRGEIKRMSFELKEYCAKLEHRQTWCICAVGVSGQGKDDVCEAKVDEVCDGVVSRGSGGGKGGADGDGEKGEEEAGNSKEGQARHRQRGKSRRGEAR